jgi:hypothetical protein
LSASAQFEFEDVADFFWKVPGFIERERELELTKLDDYFPDDPELRERRWRFESRNWIIRSRILSQPPIYSAPSRYLILYARVGVRTSGAHESSR